jgi:UDP-GlcNAc:undecaprenyl-phosphate/decaprenyl-phosphate GlcNAc-1-phosphate transferase
VIQAAVAVFTVAALVAWASMPLVARLARAAGAVDIPRQAKHIHHGSIPRWGGLGLTLGFFAACGMAYLAHAWGWAAPAQDSEDWWRLQGVLIGAVIALVFGMWDDWRELPPWPQFAVQVILSVVAITHVVWIEVFGNPLTAQNGDLITLPTWLTIPFTVFWIVGMMNTVNFLDGLDGLAGGVAFIAACLFAGHAYTLGQTTVALFALALAGACLGFLPWNFHPARIFMGTAGAAVLGYCLATFAILAPAKVATALLVLGLPILDVAWLVVSRMRRGQSPLRGSRDHLHHRLYDLGMSQRQIVLLYYGFALMGGSLALFLPARIYKLYALAALAVIGLIALWAVSRPTLRARLHRETPDG